MAGEGGTNRKEGLDLEYDKLLGKDDDPPSELLIIGAAEKQKPQEEMVLEDEEVDVETQNSIRRLSDKDLHETITRSKKFLKNDILCDGGLKLKARLKKLEVEFERRSLQKDDDKCKRVKTLADDSTCKGVANDLSHPGAPPSKDVSDFAFHFCSKLENNKAKKCFGEDLHTLSRSDPKNIRKHKPFPTQLKQNKVSSRRAPFESPNHLSLNNNSQKPTNCERREASHSFDTLAHPSDKDASCCLTKKENGALSPLPFRSRRNKRETVVLDLEDAQELEERDLLVVNKSDELDQSFKKTRIYYPSRDDPVAIEIYYSDLECLAPESYLSSSIMNFYIRYLQKPTFPSASRKHDHHIFNTYFYEKLKQEVLIKSDKEDSFPKFRRWWKDVNIFKKAYILLPIHENVHWSLIIICMPNKETESGPVILHLDSLGLHSSKSIFSNVKSFLIVEWNHLKQEGLPEPPIADNIWNKLSRRIDEKVIEVPQQKNEYDCGLFVLHFMERFINEAPERLKKQDLGMFGRQWFRPEEASNLRMKIHSLLKEEFKNASEDTYES